MLILIAFLPAKFAIDHTVPTENIVMALSSAEQTLPKTLAANPKKQDEINTLTALIATIKEEAAHGNMADAQETFKFRKGIQTINPNFAVE